MSGMQILMDQIQEVASGLLDLALTRVRMIPTRTSNAKPGPHEIVQSRSLLFTQSRHTISPFNEGVVGSDRLCLGADTPPHPI